VSPDLPGEWWVGMRSVCRGYQATPTPEDPGTPRTECA
jgi:hypothetical protein